MNELRSELANKLIALQDAPFLDTPGLDWLAVGKLTDSDRVLVYMVVTMMAWGSVRGG